MTFLSISRSRQVTDPKAEFGKMKEQRKISQNPSPSDMADWKRIVATYQKPSARRALWQIVNTLAPREYIGETQTRFWPGSGGRTDTLI